MIFLCVNLHIIWEHSKKLRAFDFFQLLNKNMFNGTLNIPSLLILVNISWILVGEIISSIIKKKLECLQISKFVRLPTVWSLLKNGNSTVRLKRSSRFHFRYMNTIFKFPSFFYFLAEYLNVFKRHAAMSWNLPVYTLIKKTCFKLENYADFVHTLGFMIRIMA